MNIKKLIAVALIPLSLTACVTTGTGYGAPSQGYYPPPPPQAYGHQPQGNAYGRQQQYQQPGYQQVYGTVINVQETQLQASDSVSLPGTLIGGLAGAGVGSLAGRGKGKTAMTVIGGLGGALIGNEVAKGNTAGTVGLIITVKLDDGTRIQAVQPRDAGYFRHNDRVRVVYNQQGQPQVTY